MVMRLIDDMLRGLNMIDHAVSSYSLVQVEDKSIKYRWLECNLIELDKYGTLNIKETPYSWKGETINGYPIAMSCVSDWSEDELFLAAPVELIFDIEEDELWNVASFEEEGMSVLLYLAKRKGWKEVSITKYPGGDNQEIQKLKL